MGRIRRASIFVLCAWLLAGVARADVIMPGFKSIEHTFVIEDSPLLERWDLVAFPTRGFGVAERIVPGAPFSAAKSFYGTKVYALPKGTELPAEVNAGWFEGRLCAVIPVRKVDSVPVTSPTSAIRTELVVSALSADGFALREVGERRVLDWTMLGIGAVAVGVGVVGWLAMLRRRRRARG